MADTGWTCGTCGRLNFSHHSACKGCNGMVRTETPKTTPAPPNPDMLAEKLSAATPHPFLPFALIAGVIVFMLSICVPLAYATIPLMALSHDTTPEMLVIVPLGIIGLGIFSVFVFIAVGARFLDHERATTPKNGG